MTTTAPTPEELAARKMERHATDHKKHERIWLLPHDGEQVTWCDCDASDDGEGQEYVRADLVAAAIRQHSAPLEAQIAELTADLKYADNEHHATNLSRRKWKARATKAEAALAKEEATCLQIIDQRDMAEKALSGLFSMVTGRPPEWSNLFGYSEALDECEEALAASRESERVMREALERLESANNALCATRSDKTYASMLEDGATDALHALDAARREARAALQPKEPANG